jgi:hypothetical protein
MKRPMAVPGPTRVSVALSWGESMVGGVVDQIGWTNYAECAAKLQWFYQEI